MAPTQQQNNGTKVASARRRPSPTWRQWPTVHPGGALPTVTLPEQEDSLVRAGQGRAPDGVRRPAITAHLLLGSQQEVLVEVGGQLVGSLPPGEAPGLSRCVGYLLASQEEATCRAWITGSWNLGEPQPRIPAVPGLWRSDLEEAPIDHPAGLGLVLDIDNRFLPRQPDCPFLPAGSVLLVQRTQQHTQLLDRFLGRRQRTTFTAELTEYRSAEDPDPTLTKPTLVVRGGGEALGTLPPRIAEGYVTLLRDVARAGFSATCLATLRRLPIELDSATPTFQLELDVAPAGLLQ